MIAAARGAADSHSIAVTGEDHRHAEHLARGVAREFARFGYDVRIGPLAPRRQWMGWDELFDPAVSA